jgi:hypothetical protein
MVGTGFAERKSSAFRRRRSPRRLGHAASGPVVGRWPFGPFGHLPSHLPELVRQLAEAGSDLFFCGTVVQGRVVYRYEVSRTPLGVRGIPA